MDTNWSGWYIYIFRVYETCNHGTWTSGDCTFIIEQSSLHCQEQSSFFLQKDIGRAIAYAVLCFVRHERKDNCLKCDTRQRAYYRDREFLNPMRLTRIIFYRDNEREIQIVFNEEWKEEILRRSLRSHFSSVCNSMDTPENIIETSTK